VARVITVNDVLDGHVVLDIECLDRIYLNAYVPILQTSSQVVAFLSGHLGFPFPSPALFRQMGDRFRRSVMSFADANDIRWIRFEKDQAKLEVMAPHLIRQAVADVNANVAQQLNDAAAEINSLRNDLAQVQGDLDSLRIVVIKQDSTISRIAAVNHIPISR